MIHIETDTIFICDLEDEDLGAAEDPQANGRFFVTVKEKGGSWARIDGDGTVFQTLKEAEREARSYLKDQERSNWEWRREMAMEAGMLHGVDAYNEMMGY